MNCMKCGQEIDEKQVFCEECLRGMEKYPVKPGTVVLLPKRTDAASPKKSHGKRRGNSTPEEQIAHLKKRLWLVTTFLIMAVLLVMALLYPTVAHFLEQDETRPGQNYSAMDSTEQTQAE